MNFSELTAEQKVSFLFNQIKRDTKQIESLKGEIRDLNQLIKKLEVELNKKKTDSFNSKKEEIANSLVKNKQLKKWQSLAKAFIKKHELKEEFNEFLITMTNNISE